MKAFAAAILSFLGLPAVAMPAAGGDVASGLRGVASRSPTSPVCRSDDPCSAPAGGVVLLFTTSGRIVARTRTDAVGRYRIRLLAGSYGVRLAATPRPGSALTPRQVRVPRGRFAHVDFTIDTGIR